MNPIPIIVGSVGGGLLGSGIVQAAFGHAFGVSLAVIGLGLWAVGIVLAVKADSQ